MPLLNHNSTMSVHWHKTFNFHPVLKRLTLEDLLLGLQLPAQLSRSNRRILWLHRTPMTLMTSSPNLLKWEVKLFYDTSNWTPSNALRDVAQCCRSKTVK